METEQCSPSIWVILLLSAKKWPQLTVPHSLERAEVLAGFAMAVLLLFMGFDIISHTAEHLVEGYYESPTITATTGDHGAAEVHTHEAHIHHARISPGSVDLASLAALISTVISGLLLKNHARIGKGTSPEVHPCKKKRRKKLMVPRK